MTVWTSIFEQILARHRLPQRIDFMSLDVNGPEEAVMRSFPFDRHNITVLAIEGPSHGLQTLLSSQDYRLLCAVGRLDQLWVHWPSLQTDGASYAVDPA